MSVNTRARAKKTEVYMNWADIGVSSDDEDYAPDKNDMESDSELDLEPVLRNREFRTELRQELKDLKEEEREAQKIDMTQPSFRG